MTASAPPPDMQPDTEVELTERRDGVKPLAHFEKNHSVAFRKRLTTLGRVSNLRRMETPDVDIYSAKKSVSQGFMDVALLSANADQLRSLATRGDPSSAFGSISVFFLSCSIFLQVVIALCLVLKSRYNLNNEQHFRRAELINNVCMVASILLTVFNVLVSAFTGEVPSSSSAGVPSAVAPPVQVPSVPSAAGPPAPPSGMI